MTVMEAVLHALGPIGHTVGATHVYMPGNRSAICRLDDRPRSDPVTWLQPQRTVILEAVSSIWDLAGTVPPSSLVKVLPIMEAAAM